MSIYKQINGKYELIIVKRLFQKQEDIFYSNSKTNIPFLKEELGLDINPFNDERVYIAALVKRKIEELTKSTYQQVIFNSNGFSLFFNFEIQNDINLFKKWIIQEQLMNFLKIS